MHDFENLGLTAGVWSGLLHTTKMPERIVLVHLGRLVGTASISPVDAGTWQVSARLPTNLLSAGAQCFMLLSDASGDSASLGPGAEHLASMTVVAGLPLDQDLHAEVELLRAEVDLLKRELRRLATQS